MITLTSTDSSGSSVQDTTPTKAGKQSAQALADSELIQQFNTGHEEAFVEIMQRYHTKIFSIAFSLLHNRSDAEEITQDTFIRAHRGLGRFRGDSSLATWLHRIAVNLARNRYWYFFRRRRHATLSLDNALGEDEGGTFADLVAADSPDPAQESSRDEFASMVDTCMEKLEPRHREILTLRNVLNRSYEEIATALGITVGTVKSRIARARENLRAQIAEQCPEFGPDTEATDWFEPARGSGRLAMVTA